MDRKEMGKVWVGLIWLRGETGRRVLVSTVMNYRLYQHQKMHYSKHIVYWNITSFNNIGVSSLKMTIAPKHVAAN
jgi:hypothetical protein